MNILYISIIFIILLIILIYLSGWFSGTETAITQLSGTQIAEMVKNNEKNVEYIVRLKRDIDRTIITILIGNNLVNIILASIAALTANMLFQTIGISIMIGILTFLIIIFGEITPKSHAIMNSKEVCKKNAKRIYYLMKFINPIISLLIKISNKIIRLSGGKIDRPNILVSDESIKSIATLGEKEGVIKKIEKEIIHKVIPFGDIKIKDIMLSMKNTFYLHKDYSIKDAIDIIAKKGFTRVPIVDKNNKDLKVIGILHSKDLLGKKKGKIKSFMRSPFIVNRNRDVTDVFQAMKKKRMHMAIVEDRNNRHIGIVTLEDIIEQLLGEIYDEHYDVKFDNNKNLDT
jgi:CBS domain containing-hemolysin-like protein